MRTIPLWPLAAALAALPALPAFAADDAAIAREAPTSAPQPLDRAWNLSVGTGGGAFFEFVDPLGDRWPAYDRHVGKRLQLNVRLDRELGRWLRSGVAYVYTGWRDDFRSEGTPVGSIDEQAQVLMVDATFRWVRRAHVETYSALAVGYGRWTARGTVDGARYEDTSAGLAFQLRYFGVAVGGERFRVFAELGIGFEGLVVIGLTARL